MGPTLPSSEALYDFAAYTAYQSLQGTAATAAAIVLNHQLGHRYYAALDWWFNGKTTSSEQLEKMKKLNQGLLKALAPWSLALSVGVYAVAGAVAYVGQQVLFSE